MIDRRIDTFTRRACTEAAANCFERTLGTGLEPGPVARSTLVVAQTNAYAQTAGTEGTAGCFGRMSKAGVEHDVPGLRGAC